MKGRAMARAAAAPEPKVRLEAPPIEPNDWAGLFTNYRAVRDYFNDYMSWRVMPDSMDRWQYQTTLRSLDRLLLRSLHVLGAAPAGELAEYVNHRKLVRTKPKRTGVQGVSAETVSDWIDLSERRGLLAPWRDGGWQLTDSGRNRAAGLWQRFLGGNAPQLLIGLAGISGLTAVITWIAKTPAAQEVGLIILLIVGYLALIAGAALAMARAIEPPGRKVVWIEALRGEAKLPALWAASPPTRGAPREPPAR
jgi:hypothetical protein